MAKILLMEDDEHLAMVLGEVLASRDHEVVACTSATEALAHIAEHRFDLVITDIIIMKDKRAIPDGGISLISRLRGAHSWNLEPWMKDIPIIVISGAVQNKGMADLLKITRDLGADMALSKPTDIDDLMHAVNLLTQNRRPPGP